MSEDVDNTAAADGLDAAADATTGTDETSMESWPPDPGLADELRRADADCAAENTISGEELRRRYGPAVIASFTTPTGRQAIDHLFVVKPNACCGRFISLSRARDCPRFGRGPAWPNASAAVSDIR